MPFDFQQLANFRLARGSHKQPNKGGNICVNEAAVIAAGFQYREIRVQSGRGATADCGCIVAAKPAGVPAGAAGVSGGGHLSPG